MNVTKNTQTKMMQLAQQYCEVMAQIKTIEAGVVGSVFNPSDSDHAEGKIHYGDIVSQKGTEVADLWLKLQANSGDLFFKGLASRGTNSRAYFLSLIGVSK